ncbi:MAG: DNA repair protein RecO [Methylococcales symbiont of Hymedesmia sp. n. MRB-2018]|nr:MAG: DNA repair protein RecO [Methylococcales symbiont of Hymedesmia sp. n. MRB-2018]KAF3983240.1 MAG: DNA repair protein RecO [Methylococcales symbiont of Hymedesmia sp. n. MRB-2018]
MNGSVVHLQNAYILQHREFRETCLILDVLTQDFGIVSILAKGVRKKKSKTAGLLLPFSALKLSYIGKNELKILSYVELDTIAIQLTGCSLYCGFYVNELISLLLHKNDPHPTVYNIYQYCLTMLIDVKNIEQNLRFFELNLIENIGYGFQLTVDHLEADVKPFKKYYFKEQTGMVESEAGYISGHTLLALDGRENLDKQALYESKQLMRRVIDFLLQGKVLKSRRVLAKIMKQK